MDSEEGRPLIVWRLLDGRRGHLTQIEGITRALQDLHPTEPHDLQVQGGAGRLLDWLLGRFPTGDSLPSPDLILAAGHSTHIAALAARRARGGRIVVLMRPSLPLAWFDLCLVPEHDEPTGRPNVIPTRGAITTVRPSKNHDPATGLILLGGPSRHHDWETGEILAQVREVINGQREVRFQVGDSPRTPLDTRQQIVALGNIDFIPWEQTQPGEIQTLMQTAGQIWVSEDSVSMLYEALGSGAPTGLLSVPRRRETRISRGIDQLLEKKLVTPFPNWLSDRQLTPPANLDEAGRCAHEILQRWPASN